MTEQSRGEEYRHLSLGERWRKMTLRDRVGTAVGGLVLFISLFGCGWGGDGAENEDCSNPEVFAWSSSCYKEATAEAQAKEEAEFNQWVQDNLVRLRDPKPVENPGPIKGWLNGSPIGGWTEDGKPILE